MKLFFFLTVVVFLGCRPAAAPFVSKLDSVQVVYRDSVRGPFIFTGLYQTYRIFFPVGDSGITTTGKWIIDTAWLMKLQTDTFTIPGKPHLYNYQSVTKRYVQILQYK